MGNLSCVSCKSASDKDEGKRGRPRVADAVPTTEHAQPQVAGSESVPRYDASQQEVGSESVPLHDARQQEVGSESVPLHDASQQEVGSESVSLHDASQQEVGSESVPRHDASQKEVRQGQDERELDQPRVPDAVPSPVHAPTHVISSESVSLHDASQEEIGEGQAESEKPPIEACTEPTPEEHALDEKRLSAWELYDVLQQHRIKEEDDNNLDDIEKVAKAIVDLNVFLASQVIYPAYMKYMEEDHPDLYTQYFCRPSSPTPPSDNLDEAGNPCS